MTRMKLGKKALAAGMDHARMAKLKAPASALVNVAMCRAGLSG
jgi:hypothetical protein